MENSPLALKLQIWELVKGLRKEFEVSKRLGLSPTIEGYDRLLSATEEFLIGSLIEAGVPPEEIV